MAIWNKIGIAVALLVLCAVGAFFYLGAPVPTKLQPVTQPPVDAKQLPLVLQGRSYCSVTLPVPATLAGEVVESLVSIGQAVKKDDLLFKLKLSVADAAAMSVRLNKSAALRGSEVNIHKLELGLAQLERNIAEVKQLNEMGMAPRNALADLQDQVQITTSQLELARIGLADARKAAADDLAVLSKSLGQPLTIGSKPLFVFVRAPQDGHVIAIDPTVREGATVSGVLCTIGSMDSMLIRGQVHESELARLQGSSNATITLDGDKGESFNATLSRVSWAAQDSSLAAPAYYLFELVVPNPDYKIRDGFKVQVTLQPPPSKDK